MYRLDTDHMTLLERGGPESEAIKAKLRGIPQDDVATTIISYEEQTRGWLARIAGLSDISQQVTQYVYLKRQLQNYCRVAVIDFDSKAAQQFTELRQAKLRLGTMDMKIAAIALAHQAILVTRNSSDFSKVPNLLIEDWSI